MHIEAFNISFLRKWKLKVLKDEKALWRGKIEQGYGGKTWSLYEPSEWETLTSSMKICHEN